MPAVDSSRAVGRAGDALILARIWGGLIALLHLAGLAGAVAPLFLHATYTASPHVALTLVSLAHHIVALATAVMLLIGLRSGRFALLLTIALSIAHCLSLLSVSALAGAAGFGFGLFLYLPPLVLIYWRSEEFR